MSEIIDSSALSGQPHDCSTELSSGGEVGPASGVVAGSNQIAATGAGNGPGGVVPVPVAAHYQTAGWGGVPGQCGVECVCGWTLDGFDTIAEAAALLDDHIAAAAPVPARSPVPVAAQPWDPTSPQHAVIRAAIAWRDAFEGTSQSAAQTAEDALVEAVDELPHIGEPVPVVAQPEPSVVQYMREREQGMICGRCDKPTGNNHQGHYWKFCQVTKQTEVFHFCCPGDCDRASSWREAYEKLVDRFAELGITVDDKNYYLVPPKDARWVSLLAAAKAMDDIDAAWGQAVAPLVDHNLETPAIEHEGAQQ